MTQKFINSQLDDDSSDEETVVRPSFNKAYYMQTSGPKKFFAKSKAFQGMKKELDHAKSQRYQQLKARLSTHIEEIPKYLSTLLMKSALNSTIICQRSLETALNPLFETDKDLKYVWENEKDEFFELFRNSMLKFSVDKKPQFKIVDKVLSKSLESLTVDYISSQTTEPRIPTKIKSLEQALESLDHFACYCKYIETCLRDSTFANEKCVPTSPKKWKKLFSIYLTFNQRCKVQANQEQLSKSLAYFFMCFLKCFENDKLTSSQKQEILSLFKIIFPKESQETIAQDLVDSLGANSEISNYLKECVQPTHSNLEDDFKNIL